MSGGVKVPDGAAARELTQSVRDEVRRANPPTVLFDEDLQRRGNCKRDAAGVHLCSRCEVKTATHFTLCEGCHEADVSRREQREREQKVLYFEAFFEGQMQGSPTLGTGTFPPSWPWARLDNQGFRKRVSAPLLAAVEQHELGSENVICIGPTGSGKTALMLAKIHQRRESALANIRAGKPSGLPAFAWITGPELAGCRRRWKIGEESPLLERACEVPLLILDELGFEPASDEVFFAIDHRYRAAKPTIITTGLTLEGFEHRYGAALLRRLLEAGSVMEAEA